MREQVFIAAAASLAAISLAFVTWMEWRSGQVRSLFIEGSYIDREKESRNFWISWVLWAVMALFVLAASARAVWLSIVEPDPTPVTGETLWFTALLFALFGGMFAYYRLRSLWRRGPPWNGALRKERELGKLIRSLVDDKKAVYEDETFNETLDMLLEYSDLDFLEQLAAHLVTQSPPRNLRLALDELDPPNDDAIDDAGNAS